MFRRSTIPVLAIALASVLMLAGPAHAGADYPPPGVTGTVQADGSVRVTGAGCEPGSEVTATARLVGSSDVVATATGVADSQGQFDLTIPSLDPGQYEITVTCGDLTQVLGVTIAADCAAGIVVTPSSAAIGDTVTVTANCHGADADTTFTLFSDPVNLGTAKADADGTAVLSFVVPTGITLGVHRIEAVSAQFTQSVNITIVAAGQSSAALPRTGSDSSMALARIGGLLLAAGALVVFVARRRTESPVA